jgi:hypothetical protein
MTLFVDGMVLELDDYRVTRIHGTTDKGVDTRLADKGQKDELKAFARAIRGESEWPIPFWQQLQATRISFEVEDLLRSRAMRFKMRNRCGSKRIPISLFLLITTIAGITFVVGWSRLEETGMVARLYVFEGGDLPSSNAVSVHDHLLGSERGHSKMRLLLKESGFSPIKNVTLEKILNIQNWLGKSSQSCRFS